MNDDEARSARAFAACLRGGATEDYVRINSSWLKQAADKIDRLLECRDKARKVVETLLVSCSEDTIDDAISWLELNKEPQ